MSGWPGRTRAIVRPPIAQVNRLAAELAASGRDLLNLGQAVLGLPPPDSAMARVREWLADPGPHPYSPDPGLPGVREAVARFLTEHKNVPANSDQVILTCGANQAFVNALLTVSNPGDEVVLFGPGYFDHDFAVILAGCTPVTVPMRLEDQRFRLDLDATRAAISQRTVAVVLVSPGNPSGAVLDPEEVRALTTLCRDRDLWLLSDETYDLLTFPPAVHTSPATLDHGKVVVLGSFSKVFGLASWRVGYMWGPADMAEESIKVQDSLVVCAPVPSQHAVLGALEAVDDYVPRARDTLVRRLDALWEVLEPWHAVTPIRPQGATFVLARIHDTSDDVAFARDLLVSHGIITVPGSAFGEAGRGHLRISFGNQPVARIRELSERLSCSLVR